MLIDDDVIKSLATLMEDTSWKVKAHAIRGTYNTCTCTCICTSK